METLYPAHKFESSDRLHLKTYFNDFSSLLPENNEKCEEASNVEASQQALLDIGDSMGMDLSLAELQELSQICSIDHLNCDGENIKDFPIGIPTNIHSNSKLPADFMNPENISTLQTNTVEEIPEDDAPRKYRLYSLPNVLEFPTPSSPPDLKPGSDFIVTVSFVRPFAFKYFSTNNTSNRLQSNQEILMLGQNTLEQLRDKISCSSDSGSCVEVQSTSDVITPFANSKEQFPSGFLFIDDVFYNDCRQPHSIDYSIPLMEWARRKSIPLKSQNMKDVRIDSLTFRLGYPYLYMHQGDCEHLLIFSDAKLLQESDCLHSSCYPHVSRLLLRPNAICCLCTVSVAKWICIDSDRLPQNKQYLCTECCNAYHYIDGKKVGTFKLYPYFDKHVS